MIVTKDDLRGLIGRLSRTMNTALDQSIGMAMSQGHHEVTPEHLLISLIQNGNSELATGLKASSIDIDAVTNALRRVLADLQGEEIRAPKFSRQLLELLELSWIIASIRHGFGQIRSGVIIACYLEDPRFSMSVFGEFLESIDARQYQRNFEQMHNKSEEAETLRSTLNERTTAISRQSSGALANFTVNLTQRARDGEIDAISGRDIEILQVIDVLSSRKKNNPILVGEAGVGKTAVVEGLALKIAAGTVLEDLRDCEILALDLGMLQAGAGVKGEFESRLKAIVNEVVDAGGKYILFIDEAHTLIGAGGAAGSGDAANLLKPALARGQLRTIAATTWSEYKKYIEKDPALERRFQLVKIDEPDIENATAMMRGLRTFYEKHHKVTVRDSALRAAVELSDRYITGRQLPDKAVDLLDTASARVRISQTSRPKQLELLERRRHYSEQKLAGLRNDLNSDANRRSESIADIESQIEKLTEQIMSIESDWVKQRDLVTKIKEKCRSSETAVESPVAQQIGVDGSITALRTELRQLQTERLLVIEEVDDRVVADVVADWTGIPVGRMIQDQAAAILDLENMIAKSIVGQDHALRDVANALRVSKASLSSPESPIGVFLFVGPSGVGKTETGRLIAEYVFGGERFLTTINMSEYEEKHTVSQLKGSPPGYVGYGEGGVLTEAVRRRPYSVVLLDEVEKAHRDVMNLFYQVFDKGTLRDGEGREINFKNTVIIMTSNLGTEQMMDLCERNPEVDPIKVNEVIQPILLRHFQAALLARMRVIPFYPLRKEHIERIVRLKLDALGTRLHSTHRIELVYSDQIVTNVADRCQTDVTGARAVEFIINRSLLPDIARSVIQHLASDRHPSRLELLSSADKPIDFLLT